LASIHLVNLSTATNRCVKPPGSVLNGPTMSRPQTANGQVSGMVLRAAATVFLCLEKRWQPALLHQLLCILLGRRPKESMVESLGHQCSGGCVVPALPLVYLS
jgi:hypothetical protein